MISVVTAIIRMACLGTDPVPALEINKSDNKPPPQYLLRFLTS